MKIRVLQTALIIYLVIIGLLCYENKRQEKLIQSLRQTIHDCNADLEKYQPGDV
jgi:hypothetical protein